MARVQGKYLVRGTGKVHVRIRKTSKYLYLFLGTTIRIGRNGLAGGIGNPIESPGDPSKNNNSQKRGKTSTILINLIK